MSTNPTATYPPPSPHSTSPIHCTRNVACAENNKDKIGLAAVSQLSATSLHTRVITSAAISFARAAAAPGICTALPVRGDTRAVGYGAWVSHGLENKKRYRGGGWRKGSV
eukprot:GFKZ01005728.1.p1 GENE.GFKZ01005728.1~~GFKZ01005728.1.p1  ORF type:complete len:121 (+),score=1.84 GFKZ01005728.1:36-365(+)